MSVFMGIMAMFCWNLKIHIIIWQDLLHLKKNCFDLDLKKTVQLLHYIFLVICYITQTMKGNVTCYNYVETRNTPGFLLMFSKKAGKLTKSHFN